MLAMIGTRLRAVVVVLHQDLDDRGNEAIRKHSKARVKKSGTRRQKQKKTQKCPKFQKSGASQPAVHRQKSHSARACVQSPEHYGSSRDPCVEQVQKESKADWNQHRKERMTTRVQSADRY